MYYPRFPASHPIKSVCFAGSQNLNHTDKDIQIYSFPERIFGKMSGREGIFRPFPLSLDHLCPDNFSHFFQEPGNYCIFATFILLVTDHD